MTQEAKYKRVSDTRSWFFKIIKKNGKPLTRLMREERKHKDERGKN